jgi:hypothetical protein
MMFRARLLVTFAALSSITLLAGCGEFYGKPRGTVENNATTRAVDRAAGTNTSTEHPLHSDGMPGNPPGTAVSRAVDKVVK